jgi:hypothetical protein
VRDKVQNDHEIRRLYGLLLDTPKESLSDCDVGLMAVLAGHPAVQTALAAKVDMRPKPPRPCVLCGGPWFVSLFRHGVETPLCFEHDPDGVPEQEREVFAAVAAKRKSLSSEGDAE